MSEQKFDAWCIVELFGHQRVAGKVTEQAVGGCNFVRVDIPKDDGFYTRLFGNGAIYAINVTDEKTARVAAAAFSPRLPMAWELERAARLPSATTAGSYAPDDDPDDQEF